MIRMKTLHDILLVIHIVGGFTSLVVGMVPNLVEKGGKAHVISGLVFYWAMFAATLSGAVLAVMMPSQFLFFIGIFSFYGVYMGRRILFLTRRSDYRFTDYLVWGLTTVICLAMVLVGSGLGIATFFGTELNIVLLIFGGLGLIGTAQDARSYWQNRFKSYQDRVASHISRIMGAYIASWTAFLVVNGFATRTLGLPWLDWLGPTALISPLISVLIARYRKGQIKTTVWRRRVAKA